MGVLNYLSDKNLEFLSTISNEELSVLVNILIKDNDGNIRDSEDLTLQPEYKAHGENYLMYWQKIAAELQYFGGNTIANGWRGHGVSYGEILEDVCKHMKITVGSKDDVTALENKLVYKIFAQIMDEMPEDQIRDFAKEFGTSGVGKQATVAAIQAAIRLGGFASYKMSVIVVNVIAKQMIGRGLTVGANAALTRTIGAFAGPIGLILTGVWTAIALAGPAYRVTVPAVIYISFLRSLIMKRSKIVFCDQAHENPIGAKFCNECGYRFS